VGQPFHHRRRANGRSPAVSASLSANSHASGQRRKQTPRGTPSPYIAPSDLRPGVAGNFSSRGSAEQVASVREDSCTTSITR